MQRIETVGAASGKSLGIHVIEPKPDELKNRIEQGYRFVAYSVDIRMLDCACRRALEV
jgi:2-dehydro-3-deoxyglucarate aldolase